MIVGFRMLEIHAKAEEKPGKVEVSSTPKIVNVKKFESKELKDVLRLDFEFMTKYEPKVGEIKIVGYVLYKDENIEKILKLWEEKKALDMKTAEECMNFILRKCLIKVTYIADELGLPPAVRFPVVKAKTKGK